MSRAGWAVAFVLAGTLGATACGYHLSGRGGTSALPEHIKNITILPFENRTNRPEIEQRVTEEVARLMSQRGNYRITADRSSADAVMAGAVTSYTTSAVQFSSEGRATLVEAVVQIAATVRDASSDEILWSQAGLVFREQFQVPPTSAGTVIAGNVTGSFDEESLALDDIARGTAETLVNSIFESF